MMFLIVMVVCTAVAFGLFQWARSGALFWEIHDISKHRYSSSDAADAENKAESAQKSIQRMETTLDRLLKSSFRVMGIVALCVWFFVMFSLIMDLLGLDWIGSSANRALGSPTARARTGSWSGSSGVRNAPARSGRPSTAENVRNFRWQ